MAPGKPAERHLSCFSLCLSQTGFRLGRCQHLLRIYRSEDMPGLSRGAAAAWLSHTSHRVSSFFPRKRCWSQQIVTVEHVQQFFDILRPLVLCTSSLLLCSLICFSKELFKTCKLWFPTSWGHLVEVGWLLGLNVMTILPRQIN